MKAYKLIYTALIVTILLNACQKEINFDADLISSKMVINGFIEPDSCIDIRIASSKPIPGVVSDYNWLENASAVLYENDVKIETLETYDLFYNENENQQNWDNSSAEKRPTKGYRSKLKASAEKTYKLEVSHPDYDEVYCETFIPKPVDIISIDTSITNSDDGYRNEEIMSVKLKFHDPANEVNYYRLVAYLVKGEARYEYYKEDEIDTIVYVSESYLPINDPIINPEQEEANDILFSTPSNVHNVFTDELIDGTEYTVNFNISLFNTYQDNYYGYDQESIETENDKFGQFYKIMFILQSISRESYLYLKSSYEHKYYDGQLFVEPVQVFTNIENGIGIFAGQSSSTQSFTEGEYPIDGVIYQEDYYNRYYY